jgi:hypothetical protein
MNKINKGTRKTLLKWYNQKYSEKELLILVTKHKSGYGWSNKDLFKLIHIKAKSQALNLIIKFVMFGFQSIKDLSFENQNEQEIHNLISAIEKVVCFYF